MTHATIRAEILDEPTFPFLIPVYSKDEVDKLVALLGTRPVFKATTCKVTEPIAAFVGLVRVDEKDQA